MVGAAEQLRAFGRRKYGNPRNPNALPTFLLSSSRTQRVTVDSGAVR
jgi:hypothetical protein